MSRHIDLPGPDIHSGGIDCHIVTEIFVPRVTLHQRIVSNFVHMMVVLEA